MTAVVVVVGGVGSQPALGAGLTAVPSFVKSLDSHGIGLKELLNDVAVGIVKAAAEISSCKGGEITHPVNKKLRVRDAVFLFEFIQEPFSWVSTSVPRKSCVEHDFRIHINRGVKPRFLFIFELNLLFVNCDTIRFCGEILVVLISVRLVPVVNRGSAPFDAEPLAEVSTLR